VVGGQEVFKSFGPMEIGLVLLIILIVFGVGKLPQVGGAIGKGIREFRRASRGEEPQESKTDSKAQVQAQLPESEKTIKS
jgi:sec-independent protein translocase protein TatA